MLKTYKIQDICMLEKGKQIDTSLLDDNNPYQYINGGISASGYYDKYNTKENTIIVSEGGASCGYVNFMTEKFWCGCHCYRLMEPKVKSEYLYYALKANQHGIMRLRSGCAMPNIKKSSFYNMQIKLDDNQDNQIKVTSILKKVTTLILKRKEQLTKIDFLVKSRFLEMFGDPISNSKGWEITKLEDLGELSRGISKSRPRNLPELLGGKYPLVQTGDVANSELYITRYNSTYSELGLKQSKMWKAGTLCITIAANIAKTAILKFDACFPDSIVGFKSNGKTNQIFIHYIFSFFQELLESQAPTVAQKNINLQTLQNLMVICPPSKFQNDFESFIQQLDKSKFRIKKSLEKLEMTYKALLQEYFG